MYIINYHNVLDEELDAFDCRLPRITQNDFEKQMQYLSNNFDIVSVKDMVDEIGKEFKGEKDKVAITFDDGCLGVLKFAIPIMEKYKIPATLYVVTEFTNNSDNFKYYDSIEIAFRLTKCKRVDLSFMGFDVVSLKHDSNRVKYMKYVKRELKVQESKKREENTNIILELLSVSNEQMKEYMYGKEKYLFLSWQELDYIKNLGFDIGSHTRTHPTLSKIPITNAHNELSKSYLEIKRKLNLDELSFAYPHGNLQHIGNEIPNIVKQVGYTFALTTIPDRINNLTDKFLVNRMTFEEFIDFKK